MMMLLNETVVKLLQKHSKNRDIILFHTSMVDAVISDAWEWSGLQIKEMTFNNISEMMEELNNNYSSKNYYLLEAYGENIETFFEKKKGKEVEDYVFITPKVIKIQSNLSYYKDIRDNEIWNMPANMSFTLRGYGAKITFQRNISVSISRFEANTGAVFHSGNKLRVGKDVAIKVEQMADCHIGNKVGFGEASVVNCAEHASISIGDKCQFGRVNRIIANRCHNVQIGEDILTAENCIFRAGDGHTMFDVQTGEKRNFIEGNIQDNSLIIGNHVWTGVNVICIAPSIIGSGTNVGACSVVKGKYPNNCIVCGNMGRVVKENTAWARSNNTNDMEKSCGNLYILPTVHRDSDLRYQLVDITDLQDYCEHLSQLSDCIVAIAVKNTLGKKLCEPEMAALKKIGVALDLQGRLRKGYAFVSDNSIKVMEKLGGVDEDVCFNQYVGEYHFRVESNPFNSSNSVSIQIDEKEYSTNLTGLNFVVWDKKEGKLIDSCCFDTNVADVSCTRKILFT